MSTTAKEMILETTLTDKMDNTTETTAKHTVETTVTPTTNSTAKSVAMETEATNGTLLFLFNHSCHKFHFICTK